MAATHELAGTTLLVVEDDYLQAVDAAVTLSTAGGYVIGPASTAREALDLGERHHLSAAVLDLNLDGFCSFSVADRLLADDVRVVFATAYRREVLPERFANCEVLEKPMRPDVLVRALQGRGFASVNSLGEWTAEQEMAFVQATLHLYAVLQAPYQDGRGRRFPGFCRTSERTLFALCRRLLPTFRGKLRLSDECDEEPASLYPMAAMYLRQLQAWTKLGRRRQLSAIETRFIFEAALPQGSA